MIFMMIPKGFFVLLFIYFVLGSRFVFGVAAVKDKDVWSSNLEKGMGSTRNLEVRFNGPAKHRTDALPIGNGRLGAMIWGGVANETINLNGKKTLLSLELLHNGKLFL